MPGLFLLVAADAVVMILIFFRFVTGLFCPLEFEYEFFFFSRVAFGAALIGKGLGVFVMKNERPASVGERCHLKAGW
ncbi:MAG: hypothetical protein R2874_11970 [Desulfobacterales bacterium]